MAEFDFYGNIIESDVVDIASIREKYPAYNDDQLLETAISLAQSSGGEIKILWDGSDIHFSGQVNHELKGFGGIDFNGANIFMPNFSGTYILSIKPDDTYDKSFNADDFSALKTTNQELFGKIFTMNSIHEGIASMSLGKRYGLDSEEPIYSCPTIKVSSDGVFETGELYLRPQNGNVLCRNIHEYPRHTFVVKNATIHSYSGNNFTCFLECLRSNTKISNFVLKGRTTYSGDFKFGVFHIRNCCDVEFCHISGTNPITRGYNSGYAFAFTSMAFSKVHHVFLGDSNSWGCMGGRFSTNCKFESCFLDRWDSHFGQFGHNIIDNCVIGRIAFGLGNGSLTVKNSTLLLKDTNLPINDVYRLFDFASHSPGGYNGTIVIDNCEFKSLLTNGEKYAVLHDASSVYKVPSDSVITPSDNVMRIIRNCRVDESCKYIVVTGTDYEDDKRFFNGYQYIISDSVLSSESIIKSLTAQNIKSVRVKSCDFSGQLLKNITCDVQVSDCKLDAITCDTTLPNVIMTGCILTGTQGTSNFTKYAFSGNIASDMASVNKHG